MVDAEAPRKHSGSAWPWRDAGSPSVHQARGGSDPSVGLDRGGTCRRAGAGLWRRRERLRRLCRRRRGGPARAHDQSRIRRPSRRRDLGALHHGYRLGRHHRHPRSLPPRPRCAQPGSGSADLFQQRHRRERQLVAGGGEHLRRRRLSDGPRGGPGPAGGLHHLPARRAGLPAARPAPRRGDDGRRLRPRKRTAGPWHAGFQSLPHRDPCRGQRMAGCIPCRATGTAVMW